MTGNYVIPQPETNQAPQENHHQTIMCDKMKGR